MTSSTLAQAVYDLLKEDSPPCAETFKERFKCSATDPKAELIELNRFWRIELGRVHADTLSERECLIDNLDSKAWLRYFRDQVAPTIIRFELPWR